MNGDQKPRQRPSDEVDAHAGSEQPDKRKETSTPGGEVSSPTATTIMPVAPAIPSLQPYFTPAIFKVYHDTTPEPTIVQPLELVGDVADVNPRNMTANHLILDRFWEIVERESGRSAQDTQLLLYVPGYDPEDACETARLMEVGRDVRKWRAALQLCHEERWRECDFRLIDENASEVAAREVATRRAADGAGRGWFRWWR